MTQSATYSRRRRLAPRSAMLGKTLAVLGGTAGGQIVAVAATPLLTRMYSPTDYGGYSYLSSLALIVAGFACLRLERAVPLPESEARARDILWLATASSLVISGLLVLGILGVRQVGGAPPVLRSAWVWCVPLAVFMTAQYTLWSQASLRLENYSAVARRSFTQNSTMVLLQALLAPLRWGVGGLMLGQLGARTLSTVQLIISSRKLLGRPRWAEMRGAIRRYSQFPCIMAPAALFNVLGTYLPILFVGWLYGAAPAGHIGVAQQLVLLPASILGTAVGQVYIGQLSAKLRQRAGGNRRIFLLASAGLAAVAVPFAVVVAAAAPTLLPVLLGERWASAGPMAAVMSISAAFGLVASPLSYVLVAFERSWTTLGLDVLRVVLVGSAGYFSFAAGAAALQATFAMYLAQAVVYLLTWLTCLRIVGQGVSG